MVNEPSVFELSRFDCIIDSPLCRCGGVENAKHYFSMCTFYRNKRAELIRIVSKFFWGQLLTVVAWKQ